ncbi:methylated-DNA--[protein]-cysteine S-methyltransferase [Halomonas denitrificans]|nr:methylated-DNA--[protein]-cysteine S-methyltransferase [Halomonas denitrificans]
MTAPLDPRLLAACRRALDDPDARVSDLAAAVGMSTGHFQRAFRQSVGLPPGEFLRARRLARFVDALEAGLSVTDAVHAAGYGSTSRAHQAAGEGLGMTPSRARAGGHGERIEFGTAACALGRVLVAATGRGLCAVQLGDDDQALRGDLARRFPRAEIVPGSPAFQHTLERVVALIESPASCPDLPLDVHGTAFQRRAWKALQQIPAGSTITYAELADRMGHPGAHRAAASACGANPLAVVVPCHRVVRSDGGPGGYRWGLARKQALLDAERRTTAGSQSQAV